MTSSSMDARAKRSRAALKQALLELVAEKPLEEISVREIATRAGVSFPTFYRQYRSREALLDDIAAQEINSLVDISMQQAMDSDSARSSKAIVQFVNDHQSVWRSLLTSGATAAMREQFVKRSREMAITRNFDNPDFPIELMAPFIVAGIFEILSWWLRQPDEVSTEHVTWLLDVLVFKPTYGYKDVSSRDPASSG